ncbi:MAG: VWA domain-containing protein [Acidobacteriota bacterium]
MKWPVIGGGDLAGLLDDWQARWPEALAAWSPFTKLTEPRWCLNEKDDKAEHLTDSFAMIRLDDHAIVISLKQVRELGLETFPVEIMAHEVGHHVLAPADLRDNARLLAHIRAGLPTRESFAPLVSNLYTDLLINDRLQRTAGLKMKEVYRKLKRPDADRLWKLYMRMYEVLWSLPSGELVDAIEDRQIQCDAQLGARVVRAYAKDWLDGAGRFACLLLPYLLELKTEKIAGVLTPWLDTQRAGEGGSIPDGLAEIDESEIDGAIHPAEDPELSGLEAESDSSSPQAGGRAEKGGRKNQYRSPKQYTELMDSLGVKLSENEVVIRYYRELATPHLVRFPVREVKEAQDPLPEGVDVWDAGSPLQNVDWVESLTKSPHVIPGVTTVERVYGTSEGSSPERLPVDLYLGVDCSGSMFNPKHNLSYPVLAGAIIALSALRVGAKVMVTLSGEPGEHSSTDGFTRNHHEIMKVLTGYLGTGYSFGILRLKETFLDGEKLPRPAHILIVTDSDIFHMLDEVRTGWEIAEQAAKTARGGATFVLHMAQESCYADGIARMRQIGWNVHLVATQEDLVAFARAFSRAKYESVPEARK